MTMPKHEPNNIWSKVRDDVDLDDLIFGYDSNYDQDDMICSDR